jgi:hypothetical protein
MFKDIDNIPNVLGVNNAISPNLGNIKPAAISDPKPRCGCKSNVTTVSSPSLPVLPLSIKSDNTSNYYNAMTHPIKYSSVFDEIGYDTDDSDEDDTSDHATVDINVTFDYMTHVYVSSIAVIGLYALYRLINKSR